MLSKTETSEILSRIASSWPNFIPPRIKSIKAYEIEEGKRLLLGDDSIAAVEIRGHIVPFVGGKAEVLNQFPSVTVDMGAVSFVCNGAKVMRPGVTHLDSFNKGGLVTVRDQQHRKILAVGIALEDSESAKIMTKGYVIENIHYISDKAWEAFKQI